MYWSCLVDGRSHVREPASQPPAQTRPLGVYCITIQRALTATAGGHSLWTAPWLLKTTAAPHRPGHGCRACDDCCARRLSAAPPSTARLHVEAETSQLDRTPHTRHVGFESPDRWDSDPGAATARHTRSREGGPAWTADDSGLDPRHADRSSPNSCSMHSPLSPAYWSALQRGVMGTPAEEHHQHHGSSIRDGRWAASGPAQGRHSSVQAQAQHTTASPIGGSRAAMHRQQPSPLPSGIGTVKLEAAAGQQLQPGSWSAGPPVAGLHCGGAMSLAGAFESAGGERVECGTGSRGEGAQAVAGSLGSHQQQQLQRQQQHLQPPSSSSDIQAPRSMHVSAGFSP